MKLTVHLRILFVALCFALLAAVATAAGAGSVVAKTDGTFAGSAQPSTAPLNPAYVESLVRPVFAAPLGVTGGQGLGLRPGPQDLSHTQGMQVPATRYAPLRGALPPAYDLRSFNRVTSVKDQDPYGTCWAFASLGSLESGLLPGESLDFSEDNMVLTSGFNFPGTLYDAGGNLDMSTAYLTRWGGPVYESEDAYGDGFTPAGLTPRKHVQEINWIPGRGSSLDNDNIKSAITQYGAAYVAIGWDEQYYRAATASFYRNDSSSTNHAVLIVGWDDDYPAANFGKTPPGNGAFIVRNSWGASWGSGGYFHVSYYDTSFGRDIMAVFPAAESVTNYTGIYQYDPLGDCAKLGYTGSATGWFANAFTAQSTASLSAVGFYTLTPGTTYEVYTGSGLEAKTLSTSGTQAFMGYHTVALPTPVTVTDGQQFVVAVKVTSPGTDRPIAFEAPYANYSSAARASAEQSYVSPNGSSWTDLTTLIANANVCLKAYTTAAVIPAPTVTGIDPASGPVGTSVTLTGSNLTGASAVRFNGAAASFSVDSATRITATVPAGATSGTVSVTTPGGGATSAASFSVTPSPTPTISGLAPTAGPAGTRVTLTGTGFLGAGAVAFNGVPAVFTVDSATQITATVPAGATSGTIAVTTPGGGASSAASFTVIPPPSIALFAPATGAAGASVTLTGANFEGASSVRFNGATASFSVDSATQITATVPAGATSGTIAVTTPGGGATSAASFTVIQPPSIALFTPASGPAGTSVTLTGSGFAGATAVTFNGAGAASFTVVGPTQITATVPAGATTGTIAVTTPGGSVTSVASFTVIAAPSITGLAPASGPVGTIVTITGSGFAGASAVTVGGSAASFSVVSSTQITATVPDGAGSGPVAVTAPGGNATSVANFTVILPPTVASVTPASGPVGAVLTLTGSGFGGATAVRFNGRAASFRVVSSTQITTTVPAGATTGPIAVTTPGGTATSVASFTVVVTSKATLKLSGLKRGVLARGKSVTASGRLTPVSLAGGTVKLTAQLKKSGRWTTVKSVSATSSLTGSYSWKYKPAKKGAYRMRATVTKTATRTAAATSWRTFSVK